MSRTAKQFADEVKTYLDARAQALRDRLRTTENVPMEPTELIDKLKGLSYAERRACDICALWAAETPEQHWDLKLGLLRQAQDEGRHYALYKKRIEELGSSVDGYEPVHWKAYWDWVEKLPTLLERMAAQQFSGESNAKEFLRYFAARADDKTRRVVEMTIPDEDFHAALGYAAMVRLADTPESQELVWATIRSHESFKLNRE